MNKDFKLEIKAVGDDGTFEGFLSVYNVVDLGNDLVEPGAFSKTIQENGGVVPMLWQHKSDSPIGDLRLEDTKDGLKVYGTFLLEVNQAREAYALVKARIVKGLSIGYNTVKAVSVNGVRHLKELKLLEGSVVTFPMLPVAQIASVKAEGEKSTFVEEFERARIFSARYMMHRALENSLDEYCWNGEGMDREARIQAIGESIDQFKAAYLELIPKLFDLWGEKQDKPEEEKREISAAMKAQGEEIIAQVQALLSGEAAHTSEGTAEAVDTSTKEAAAPSSEPDAIHSTLMDSINGWKSQLLALTAKDQPIN